MRRVLLIGGSGMLGSNIVVSNPPFELYPTYLKNRIAQPGALQLDISDRDSVLRQVEAIQPDAIVHTGGMTKPTECEKEPDLAHRVNVEGTAHLVEAASSVGARFIFLSSDLVFDGSDEQHDENSPTHPLSVYGQTKVEGEELVRARSNDFAIVRTTVMYGWTSRYTESMAEWVLRGLQESQERYPEPRPEQRLRRDQSSRRRAVEGLNMYHDQYRQFIFINDLVAAIFELIDLASPLNETILVVGPELISRYEFALRLARTFGLPETGIRSTSFDSTPQTAFTSKRLCLDTSKAARILKTPMRGIDEGLRAMVALAEEGYRERFDCIF